MTRETQKDEELIHLNQVLNLLNFDCNNIENGDEPPDFFLEIANKTVGIEITKLYRSFSYYGNAAKLQKIIPKIIDKTISIFTSKSGPPLVFAFGFNGNQLIHENKKFSEKLASFLLAYCNDDKNKEKELPHIIPINFDCYPELSAINNIVVDRSLTNKPEGFIVSSFNTIEANICDIDAVIMKKSSDTKRYSRLTSEKWLIIILPTMLIVGDLSSPSKMLTTIEHEFTKVYIFDSYQKTIIEVIKRDKHNTKYSEIKTWEK